MLIKTVLLKLDSRSPYIHQGNKLDKERKIVRKKLSFMHTKDLMNFLKYRCKSVWVQFHVYR